VLGGSSDPLFTGRATSPRMMAKWRTSLCSFPLCVGPADSPRGLRVEELDVQAGPEAALTPLSWDLSLAPLVLWPRFSGFY
jgi:hypothetical protein